MVSCVTTCMVDLLSRDLISIPLEKLKAASCVFLGGHAIGLCYVADLLLEDDKYMLGKLKSKLVTNLSGIDSGKATDFLGAKILQGRDHLGHACRKNQDF